MAKASFHLREGSGSLPHPHIISATCVVAALLAGFTRTAVLGRYTYTVNTYKGDIMYALDFRPSRVCTRNIHVEVSDDGNTIENVVFFGGCNGNTKAVAKLVQGKPVDEIVELLAGNQCLTRGTSCADQMTIALRQAQAEARANIA